jgi:hypothetical protein
MAASFIRRRVPIHAPHTRARIHSAGCPRFLVLAIALAGAAIAIGLGNAKPAFACDTNYWNVHLGCEYYTSNASHTTGNDPTYTTSEGVRATFTPSDGAIRAIRTNSAGSWLVTAPLLYNHVIYFFNEAPGDRNGCWNPNVATYYVNCRAADTF